jgi:hypothetical protein
VATSLKFERPGALKIEYRRAREGPNSYLIWEPHKSYICMTGADVIRETKWTKGTATGAALREWIESVEGSNDDGDITVGAAA